MYLVESLTLALSAFDFSPDTSFDRSKHSLRLQKPPRVLVSNLKHRNKEVRQIFSMQTYKRSNDTPPNRLNLYVYYYNIRIRITLKTTPALFKKGLN